MTNNRVAGEEKTEEPVTLLNITARRRTCSVACSAAYSAACFVVYLVAWSVVRLAVHLVVH